ncbi:uncharacterized protein FA14DRAFT_117419 [Meira miltonrushii]|uniref:Mitochondrial fission process protein 1 n=1 Tax=Meira miltonrushii TaxID=1280837 RepID=A0A316VK08_9BASI|nr:uncharacterized protein FA14DRAFT_117419 [Meira miltonrushii]PWN37564.1 hypothetical protein FA14DRAFT_117419 [Meira miltonrushii]
MSGLEKPDELQAAIEEGPSRYAAFAMRLRTLITASSRYIAYSSDIGEAFRPLTNPLIVRSAYGISWAYILGDCGYAGYLAHKERQGTLPSYNPLEASEGMHVGLVVARRAVFQSLASMALPAFTIHSIVRYSAPLFARSANARIRGSGPTIAGLAAVPALPFMFDHPVEHAVDYAFDFVEQQIAEAKAKAQEALDKKTK